MTTRCFLYPGHPRKACASPLSLLGTICHYGWCIMRMGAGQVGSIGLTGNDQKWQKINENQWKCMVLMIFLKLFILQIRLFHPTQTFPHVRRRRWHAHETYFAMVREMPYVWGQVKWSTDLTVNHQKWFKMTKNQWKSMKMHDIWWLF